MPLKKVGQRKHWEHVSECRQCGCPIFVQLPHPPAGPTARRTCSCYFITWNPPSTGASTITWGVHDTPHAHVPTIFQEHHR